MKKECKINKTTYDTIEWDNRMTRKKNQWYVHMIDKKEWGMIMMLEKRKYGNDIGIYDATIKWYKTIWEKKKINEITTIEWCDKKNAW